MKTFKTLLFALSIAFTMIFTSCKKEDIVVKDVVRLECSYGKGDCAVWYTDNQGVSHFQELHSLPLLIQNIDFTKTFKIAARAGYSVDIIENDGTEYSVFYSQPSIFTLYLNDEVLVDMYCDGAQAEEDTCAGFQYGF
jgi:hypothetical protein